VREASTSHPPFGTTHWAADDGGFRATIRNQSRAFGRSALCDGRGYAQAVWRKTLARCVAGVPRTSDFRRPSVDMPDYTEGTGLSADCTSQPVLRWCLRGRYGCSQNTSSPRDSQAVRPNQDPFFRLAGNLNNSDPSHYGVTAGAGVENEQARTVGRSLILTGLRCRAACGVFGRIAWHSLSRTPVDVILTLETSPGTEQAIGLIRPRAFQQGDRAGVIGFHQQGDARSCSPLRTIARATRVRTSNEPVSRVRALGRRSAD